MSVSGKVFTMLVLDIRNHMNDRTIIRNQAYELPAALNQLLSIDDFQYLESNRTPQIVQYSSKGLTNVAFVLNLFLHASWTLNHEK